MPFGCTVGPRAVLPGCRSGAKRDETSLDGFLNDKVPIAIGCGCFETSRFDYALLHCIDRLDFSRLVAPQQINILPLREK